MSTRSADSNFTNQWSDEDWADGGSRYRSRSSCGLDELSCHSPSGPVQTRYPTVRVLTFRL